MPIFTRQMRKTEFANPQEAIKEMANHIRYIQEQLEYTLMNLDSSNITEIETDKTTITSSSGAVNIGGTSVAFVGKNGEVFEAGIPTGQADFRFTLKGKGGEQVMYLTNEGKLVITNNAVINIDGGKW